MLEASIQVRIMRITHSSRGTLEAKMITERRIQCGINCNLATSELFEIYTIGMASGSGSSNRGLKICHLGWVVGADRTGVFGVAASCVLVLFSESFGHRMRIYVTQTAVNLKHITDNGHCHRVSADGTTSAAGCSLHSRSAPQALAEPDACPADNPTSLAACCSDQLLLLLC